MTELRRKPRILVVGANNSYLTLFAEGFLKQLGADLFDVRSAGMTLGSRDERSTAVMAEADIDISGLSSQLISAELLAWADIVLVIAADHEDVKPPVPSTARKKFWRIRPPEFSNDDDAMDELRRGRDDVKRQVKQYVNTVRLSQL